MTDHTRLHDLYREQGQSPWLDNLRRGWITGGELQQWVDDGVRGITSNPSIFQKAIEKSGDYDEEFGELDQRRCSRSRTRTGRSSRATSGPRWASCARSTTRATASTATCRSRSRPSLARDTDGHHRERPAAARDASPSRTCT